MSLEELSRRGFDVKATNHAEAILEQDFPEALGELLEPLFDLQIDVHDLVAGGGGEGKITQSLRHALNQRGWVKRNVHITVSIDGQEYVSDSHEVDHVKEFVKGRILLEIEWNNKDPFYDRDLMNFQSLHSGDFASVGVILTRGSSLQSGLEQITREYFGKRGIRTYDDLFSAGYAEGTGAQRKKHAKLVAAGQDQSSALAKVFVADKYGSATTHWGKLMARIERGMGRPCPLVCIGIPGSVVRI